jgi:seryl-tRNA synthetase
MTLAPDTAVLSPLDAARKEFLDGLLASGYFTDAGLPGLWGRSGDFEDILEGVDAALTGIMSSLKSERMRFAPVYPRAQFELTDYIVSFPQLTGAINSFSGTDRDHAGLLSDRADGKQWDSWLRPVDTMLVPAACHPLYATLTGDIPVGGRYFDVRGHVFRHEPSFDPMRLQAFRQHDFVFVGEEAGARDFRNKWVGDLLALLLELGLDAKAVPANDPFFGRAGTMLVKNQLEDELKLELVVPIYGDLDEGTAVGSANCHDDHFGASFDIVAGDGTVAHSACVAYGLERVTLALLRTHGFEVELWPASVRERLGLSRSEDPGSA